MISNIIIYDIIADTECNYNKRKLVTDHYIFGYHWGYEFIFEVNNIKFILYLPNIKTLNTNNFYDAFEGKYHLSYYQSTHCSRTIISSYDLSDLKKAFKEFIENNELIHNLHDEFVKWRSLKVKVSTLLLNRIFTRFYYTMINVDGDKSYSNAAEKLHAYIIALWNAALVECELENDVFTFVNLNNNKDIEGIFIDNYRDYFLLKNKIDENTDSVTIFEWLLRCPILKLYINPLLLYFIEDSTYWTKETYLKGLLKYDRIESSRKTIQVKIESLMKQYNRYDQIQSWIDKYWELKEVERRIRMYERDLSESIKKNNGIEKRRELDSIINELKRKEEVLRTRLGDFVDLDLQIDLTVDNSESSVKDIELNIRNTMRNLMDKRREYINKLNLLKPLDKNIAKFVKNDYNKVKAGRESYANKTTYDYLSQYVI